jgi:NADH:ubiquinone oxidoreductase subunit F (NADH-binding)
MTHRVEAPSGAFTRGGGPTPGGHRRLLVVSTPDLAGHERQHGPLPWHGAPGRLSATVDAAGLTGRGGSGFPTGRKLAAVAKGRRPLVIANGAEGEPASAKDRTLLQHSPHLVLDGLQLAAEAVGAKRGYVYAPLDVANWIAEIAGQRRGAGWDRIPVEIVASPPAFISGEESAAVAAVEGAVAKPRDTPRRVVEEGVNGRATLVQNVETLAHLALIARHGAAWFREQGTPDEPGTFLATVSGAVGLPGVYEAPYGVALSGLLSAAGRPTEALQAVLVGGYHGAWVPAIGELPLLRTALQRYGAAPGAGVVIALPASACGLIESAKVANYLASASAGQCGPCLNGLPRIADTLTRLADGDRRPGLAAEVDRLARVVNGRGACHHPDGTSRFVRSTLRAFAAEVDLHLTGRCRARTATAGLVR